MAARVVGRRLIVQSERVCPLWFSENGSMLNTALPMREYLHTLFKPMNFYRSVPSSTGCAPLWVKTWLEQKHKTGGDQRPYSVDGNARQNINRLMYHAKQRGWLELDLIIGQWAEKNLQSLSSEELKDFEELLGCENPDLFKYLTNQMEAGEDLKHNKAFQMIRKSVESTMEYYGSFSSTRTSKEWHVVGLNKK